MNNSNGNLIMVTLSLQLISILVFGPLMRIEGAIVPSPCLTTECPVTLGSSGSGALNDTERHESSSRYKFSFHKGFDVKGEVLEVKLEFTSCIPFDEQTREGPKWYKLEAISEASGEKIGEFTAPNEVAYTEAELCPNNVITFKTNNPTILDIPRTYRWRPKAGESSEPVCFRATIFHYPGNSCETVVSCVSGGDLPPVPVQHIQDIKLDIIIEPDQRTIDRCNKKWTCDDGSYRMNTFCGCDPDTGKCITFPMKCELRKHECLYKKLTRKPGACPEEPTIATEPPKPQLTGDCKKGDGLHDYYLCTRNKFYKSKQCLKNTSTGKYDCFCVSPKNGSKLTSTEIRNVTCESTIKYDNLKCTVIL